MQEIFEICDLGDLNNEPYIINRNINFYPKWNINRKKKNVIGLNTGCSPRWPTRLWPIEYWKELANKLLKQNFEVILLGGELEDKKNIEISKETNAKYFGYFPLLNFIELIDQCDLVITQVTMAMHITIALQKKIIVMNNIFNKMEFYLYGLGEIIEPPNGCECFYLPVCKKDGIGCMKEIKVETILQSVHKLLN